MTKRMLIDAAHPEECRVVVMDGHRVDEFDLEAANRLPLKGNIYLARVVRVEPSLQAAFVEYGGNRHGFLAFGEIHPDYYQIPVADRQRLIEAQLAEAREEAEAEARDDERRAQAQASRRASSSRSTPEGDEEPENGVDSRDVVDDAAMDVPEEIAGEAPPTPEEMAADLAAELEAEQAAAVDASAPESDPGENGVEILPPSDAPPPETIGVADGDAEGESDADTEERMRERRPTPRFLRNYKIQEVIRRRQIILIQVVKEERGTKGAALTTYISLAGRFSVLMPNSPRGGGVSRKITSSSDRRRLREVIDELDMPQGMSLIVRTAGAQRPKPEIRRDCEYLLGLWNHIRERTLASTAPALIYEEADLIKRSIRDGYARDMDEIIVEGDAAYSQAREFMRLLMPEHARKIQAYRDGTVPLFARYNAEAQLDAMHEPNVQLRSGGYIVINQTEALVAIDVNSGRSTRERSIEDTALRTNLEAAEEIARQLRLRDLAGLIVVDFIDMDANRHNAMVEKRMKDSLRTDRARIQVGRISHFGLLEMSRQRLRPSLAETTFVTCPHCLGRGTVRGLESSALAVLRAIEEECAKRRAAEITVRVTSAVALYLLNKKRDRLADIEGRWGVNVLFDPDDTLNGAETRIERSKTPPAPVNERPAALRMDYAEEEAEDGAEETAEETAAADAQEAGMTAEERERRPRRRRRSRGGRRDGAERAEALPAAPATDAEAAAPAPASSEDGEAPEAGAEGDDRSPRRRGRRGGRRRREGEPSLPGEAAGEAEAEDTISIPPMPSHAVPAYAGPTPADPFGGTTDSLMAAMEAAEAAAEAALAPPPRPKVVEPAAVAAPVLVAAAPVEATVAQLASSELVGPDSVVAMPVPVAAAPAPAPAPAPVPVPAEAVIGPAILPKTVDEVAAAAPRRGGWWKR